MQSIDEVLADFSRTMKVFTESFLKLIISVEQCDVNEVERLVAICGDHSKEVLAQLRELIDEHHQEIIENREKIIPLLNIISSINRAGQQLDQILESIIKEIEK